MPTVIATPGAANANSFLTVVEFDSYLTTRLWVPATVAAADQTKKETAVIMATSVLVRMISGYREFVISKNYVRIHPTWTGSRTTSSQALPWPRTGMLDRNANPIADNVIPADLKNGTAELAVQLITTDRTAENSVVAGGLTDLTAGPVSLSFKEEFEVKVLPDNVTLMLVPSWLTDEQIEYLNRAKFEVIETSSS